MLMVLPKSLTLNYCTVNKKKSKVFLVEYTEFGYNKRKYIVTKQKEVEGHE